MSKLADAASRQTIETRLDLNVLVEAGAGSGKTHSLANRMAAGIVSGRYRVEEMAAVTFTRKAAAELRGRFQLALERRLPSAEGQERLRLERALAGLEHLFAGTIHSFCAHLLRERPVEAGIAPGFSELDELDDQEARQRAWRDYLAQLRGQQSPLLGELQRARVRPQDLDGAFSTVCTFDEVTFPAGTASAPDTAAARKAAEALWTNLQALMPTPADPESKCAALEKARRFGALLRSARSGRPADLVEALQCWEKTPKVTMCWWADDPARQRQVRAAVEQLAANFQSEVEPFLAAWRHYVYRLAMTLLCEAREFARDERRHSLMLNYGDLLSAAASLLRRNPAVRAAMQRKYRWLLVDEFQDTDPIQAEVMLLLAADESARDAWRPDAAVDPYALSLRAGALFVVGDPKQSIYRFRRADIDVYNRVRETITRSGGEVVTLTTSFRARPALCEWNNRVFSARLPPQTTAHQAAFERLDADPNWQPRRPWPKGECGLRTLTITDDVKKNGVARADARAIARYIRVELDAKRAAPGDFLILTRKKSQLAAYADELQTWDIPAEVSGAGAFGGSHAVRALVGLLRALGDPADGPAVVGVLRGPLFGISDPDLFAHRTAGGYFGISPAPPPPIADESRRGTASVIDALDRLGAYLRLTRSLPLPAAVERILDESGFLAFAACNEGTASAGDLLHAVDLVRAVAEGGGTLADAAESLELAEVSPDVESVPLEPGQRDVVRVMNLHKAKGLEARVVFLADPMGAPRKTVDVRIVREAATARGYLAISKDVGEHGSQLIAHPEGWPAHEAAEMAYVQAEETRLLYVAATRARELLVVSRWEGESKSERPWGALDAFLDDAKDLAAGEPKSCRRQAKVDLSATARARAAQDRQRRTDEASRPTWSVISATAKEHGEESGQTLQPREPRVDAGTAWGTLIHGLLEHAARHPASTRADLERLARWLIVESPELATVVPDALELVERLTSAPFWKALRQGQAVQAEVPFSILVPAGARFADLDPASTPTVMRGVIDLVYRAADGWRILDYKTDVSLAPGETLLARHGRQLARYRAAWEHATSEKVADQGIVGARAGTVEWAGTRSADKPAAAPGTR